jgi:HK97 family phage portal protein
VGLFDRFKNKTVTVSSYKMITENGTGFYAWNGNLYKSDIVRAAIRPKAQAVGKIVGKHIRETILKDGQKNIQVNPEPYIRFLLEEPNPYMTGQMLQEKLATQLELNNNAFAYIERNDDGFPMAIYPISAGATEAVQNGSGELFLKFTLVNGKTVTFRYTDIIHLRKDFNNNEIFGDSPTQALLPLMEIVNTTDQGIVKAIKNSNVVKWLLKFTQTLRPEDIKRQTKQFVDDYLNIESESVGAAATDAKADAIQVEPKDYVPNAVQMEKTVQRIYSFFNTNDKIVQGSYTEDEWISYYEANIEPVVVQLSGEYTRKLFTRRERGFGNKIMFEASNLTFASMKTKLDLTKYVDRGIMSPNEVREILHYAPREGGDTYILRKDTGQLGKGGDEE